MVTRTGTPSQRRSRPPRAASTARRCGPSWGGWRPRRRRTRPASGRYCGRGSRTLPTACARPGRMGRSDAWRDGWRWPPWRASWRSWPAWRPGPRPTPRVRRSRASGPVWPSAAPTARARVCKPWPPYGPSSRCTARRVWSYGATPQRCDRVEKDAEPLQAGGRSGRAAPRGVPGPEPGRLAPVGAGRGGTWGWRYYLTAEGMAEALRGLNAREAKRMLVARGFIVVPPGAPAFPAAGAAWAQIGAAIRGFGAHPGRPPRATRDLTARGPFANTSERYVQSLRGCTAEVPSAKSPAAANEL